MTINKENEPVTIIRVDFHCHTHFSRDSLTRPEVLATWRRRKRLDRIVVTDHNSIRGALAARERDPLGVIVGEEIMTSQGELLAFFVQEEVPAQLSPEQTIDRLRGQGAFISVSHPFDNLRKGHWELDDLLSILPRVDAIEGFNARCMQPGANRLALQFARQHGVPVTAGSDAHAAFELGAGRLLLPALSNAQELKMSVRHAKVYGRLSPWWVHMISTYAKRTKRVDGMG